MKYLMIFALLLLMSSGCAQYAPAIDEVPMTKKPKGIEKLVHKPDVKEVQTQTSADISQKEYLPVDKLKKDVMASDVSQKKTAVVNVPEASETPPKKPKVQPVVKHEPTIKKPKKKAAAKPKSKVVVPVAEKPKTQKIVIGEVEPIRLIPGDVIINARIDTGAQTTSINAKGVQAFERDGKKWVRFRLGEDEKSSVIEKPVEREVQIKRHGEASQNRFVVKMRLILGERSHVVEVSLTDRSKFTYQILIGRNFLRDIYIVDVGTKMSSQPVEYKK